MHKEIDVIEQPVKIDMVVQPVDTEIQEPTVDVAVLVDDQDIEVQDVHIVDIEMSEAFPFMTNGALNEHMDDKDVLLDGGIAVDKNDEYVLLQDLLEISAGSGTVSHPDLHGRELSNQHPISAIENLQKNLDDLGATERVYSSSNGLGEFRRWKDGNPEGEDRSGYFIAIVPGTDEIEICDATHDVYGISVHNSGFIGNQDDLYYKGRDLLNNNANDPSYAVVGIVGAMRVRTDGTARNGDYVVPNAYGEATLSENDYGYKVLSQGSYPSYNYVTIAITPQSDALSRLQSSVAGGDLGEILIKIENIENSVGDLEVKVDASTEDIEDILGEIGGLQQRVVTAEEVVKDAVEQAEEAKDVATQAASKAAQAQQDAQDAAAGAISSANQALSNAMDLKGQLQPILDWSDDEGLSNGAQGFVTQADEDHALLASLMVGNFPDGTNIAAIIQKVDQNGAMIQHLTSHIDKYSVGAYSITYGLTYNEAKSILSQEHIYVPTVAYTETLDIIDEASGEVIDHKVFTFEKPDDYAYSYKWIPFDESNSDSGKWEKQERIVPTATTYIDAETFIDETNKLAVDDLWYCPRDVVEVPEGVQPLAGGNLYIWTGYMWVWVASSDGNYQSRVIVSMKQTDEAIMSDVVALDGRATSIEQGIDDITLRVNDAEGNISTITQEVGNIQSTIATIDGTVSSLQQHASDTDASLTAIALGRFPTSYQTYVDTVPPSPYDGKRYTHPPVWNDEDGAFVFNEVYLSDNGAYYFFSEDKTKYCYASSETTYELCTISKEVTSMFDSRIEENQASISTLTKFRDETQEKVGSLEGTVKTNTESIANVSSLANKNEASITSLTNRYYHILLSVSEEEVPAYGDKYEEAPEWDAASGKYKFTTIARDDGVYYMVDANSQTYCKVVTTDNGTVLYETYGLAGSSLAAIEQKVDQNSSSIGLVVQRTDKVIDDKGNLKDDAISSKGSIIIEAINGESKAQIEASRIELTADDQITLKVTQLSDKAKDDAVKEATNLANQAESNANDYTDGKLTDYSTTAQMNSAITQKADSITSTVSKTYATIQQATELANTAESNAEATAQTLATNAETNANGYTDNKLTSYSTTVQMNSAIDQKADSITSSVSKTYATISKATELANTAESNAESTAQSLANQAQTNANNYTNNQLTNYSTTTQMNSAISQKADSITSSVAATYATKDSLGNYATTTKVAEIEQKVTANSSSIGLVVQDGKASGKLIMEAINNDTSSVTISANKIKLEGTDSISLAVSNAVTKANNATDNKLKNYATTSAITPASIVASINDSGSEVIINANKINLSGYVTISDLSTPGKTTINGSNITTGALQSVNYSYTSGTYSTAGTKVDLTNGAITSQNFAIDDKGIIYANAANLTSASIAYASLLSCVINNMLIIAGTSNQPISYLTNGSMSGLPLLNVNQDQFTITSDGFVTVKNGLNLISTGSSSTDRTALAFTVPSPYYANQYIQLSHIDAYYNTSNSRYETRWTTDSSDVIKIHSKSGGLSIDAGPNQQLHIGTTTDNNTYGQLVYINSQQTNSVTTIYGTHITIGAYGTNRIDLVGDVYLNNTLLTSGGSGGVALFG